jgi:hypothetical protein
MIIKILMDFGFSKCGRVKNWGAGKRVKFRRIIRF